MGKGSICISIRILVHNPHKSLARQHGPAGCCQLLYPSRLSERNYLKKYGKEQLSKDERQLDVILWPPHASDWANTHVQSHITHTHMERKINFNTFVIFLPHKKYKNKFIKGTKRAEKGFRFPKV